MSKDKLIHLFASCGGIDILRVCNTMPRILFWHGVDHIKDPSIEAESIRVDVFEKQIDYLAKHYDVISMDEFYRRYTNHSFRGSEITITFDDGYLNNLTCAAPILQKYSLPFMIFVSVENISQQTFFATSLARLIIIGGELTSVNLDSIGVHIDCPAEDQRIRAARTVGGYIKTSPQDKVNEIVEELKSLISNSVLQQLMQQYTSLKPMTWDDVRKVKRMGATIGSHCLDHFCCHANQSPEELRRQIIDSKTRIEEELKEEGLYFAYPNGDYTKLSNQFVHEAGYRMGFTVRADRLLRPNEDIASLPRFGMIGNYEKSLTIMNMRLKARKLLGI